jgi:TolB-like protein/cytochrome c-type biogenesis protein CcmH/NrfG
MVTRNSDVPPEKRIIFRVGINLGDVIAEKGDLFGDSVNVAARLEALCEPGGVAISRTVRDQIRDKLPFVFEDAGEHEVKNIARPVRLYKLAAAAIEALPESELTGFPEGIRRRSAVGRPIIATAAALGSLVIVAGAFWSVRPDTSPSATVISPTAAKAGPATPLVVAVAPSAALARIAAQTAPRMSIVVLPFTNLSGDPSQEYFADGFTENLTTDLSRISGSFVIARNTAETYRGKALSEKQIASELSVRYVLEGGVQKAGNHVRVNAQLIDGGTGAHLWAERYDRDSADLLQVQDEVTNQIANTLDVTLIKAESERSWRDRPSNPDAIDLTMRGNALMMGQISQEANAKARRLFEQAVELDTKNVDALVGLARTYTTEFGEGWNHVEQELVQKRIEDALAKALAVDPGSASAYSVKSEAVAYDRRQDWRGEVARAIEAAETSLALNPSGASAHAWLGRLYAKAGHPERTTVLVEQAIRLSPRDPYLTNWLYILGMSQLQMGHNDDAITSFQKSLLLAPRKVISLAGLTGAYYATGRDLEARNALNKWYEIAVAEAGYFRLNDSPDKDILKIKVELALLRLGRWPYTLDLRYLPNLSRALFSFQADEKLPQTGQPDEATLARLGIASQASATPWVRPPTPADKP